MVDLNKELNGGKLKKTSFFGKGKGRCRRSKLEQAVGRSAEGWRGLCPWGREHKERGVWLESVKAKSKQRPALKNFPSRYNQSSHTHKA